MFCYKLSAPAIGVNFCIVGKQETENTFRWLLHCPSIGTIPRDTKQKRQGWLVTFCRVPSERAVDLASAHDSPHGLDVFDFVGWDFEKVIREQY